MRNSFVTKEQKAATLSLTKSSPSFFGHDDRSPRLSMTKSLAQTDIMNKKYVEDFSYLISNKSKEISDIVSYVNVLDRLTCDYLMPEAKREMRRSKSQGLIRPREEESDSDNFNFDSSLLKDIFPNSQSYENLNNFMQSPHFKCRIRGQTATFEKLASQISPQRKTKPLRSSSEIDLKEFFSRDQELRNSKESLGNPPPPDFHKNCVDHSLAIVKRIRANPDRKLRICRATPSEPQSPNRRLENQEVFQQKKESEIHVIRIQKQLHKQSCLSKEDKEQIEMQSYIKPPISKKTEQMANNYLEKKQKQERKEKKMKKKQALMQEEDSNLQVKSKPIPKYMSSVVTFFHKNNVDVRRDTSERHRKKYRPIWI